VISRLLVLNIESRKRSCLWWSGGKVFRLVRKRDRYFRVYLTRFYFETFLPKNVIVLL